jgi:hypothetical protein
MSHRFRWLSEEKICLVRYEGEFTLETLERADAEIYAGTRGRCIRFLFDLRDAEFVVSPAEAREYASWLREQRIDETHPESRNAIIASEARNAALSLIMAATSEPYVPFELFSTVEGACSALGIDLSLVEDHTDVIPV